MRKTLILILIVVIVAAAGAYFIINFLKPTTTEIVPNNEIPNVSNNNQNQVVDDGIETLENRGGWHMDYPSDWLVESCADCPDPTDPNVFVSFLPPAELGREGRVQVIPLAPKPANKEASVWYSEVRGVEQSLIFLEDVVTVGGATGYRIRYKDPKGLFESETIYVLSSDNRAYTISFAGGSANVKLEALKNFNTYQTMLQSFKLVEPQRAG